MVGKHFTTYLSQMTKDHFKIKSKLVLMFLQSMDNYKQVNNGFYNDSLSTFFTPSAVAERLVQHTALEHGQGSFCMPAPFFTTYLESEIYVRLP